MSKIDGRYSNLLYYREFGSQDAPSIQNFFSDSKYKNQDIIIRYLQSGEILGAACRCDTDKITGEDILPIRTHCILTDGRYSWSSDLAYYVEKYNMRLPRDFEEMVLQAEGIK